MAWPLSQDYNEAIQDPQGSLDDAELRGGEATTNALGMPMPRSGNFADVYEFKTPATNSKWAIKCFTRHVPGLRERYTEISNALKDARLPFAVEFQYLVKGIRVRGDWYPILKMRWVEGLLLNEFVRDNLDKPALLGNLGLIWGRMAKRLREAGVAHADLQHGNVLLVAGSKSSSLAVKLIDYDGMFVPALANKKSGEVGHPNYQHPQRLREGIYNAEVDRYPLLVVATALKALSVGGRELWERYDNGDNLLFRETDLRTPAKSKLFHELQDLPDPQVRKLVDELKKATERNLEDAPAIDELLPETKSKSVSVPATAKAPVEEVAAPDFNETRAVELEPRPKKKRGVPMWALIGGGAAAAVLVGIVLIAGIVWAVLSNSKGGGPVAHKKGGDEGGKPAVVKDGKTKPPSRDAGLKPVDPDKDKPPSKDAGVKPVDPDKDKPPTPVIASGDFVPLFNGKDLAGWKRHPQQPGDWRVDKGVLIGSGSASRLYVEKPYEDFHLRLETRINNNGVSAVLFRAPFGPLEGYEADILDKTGSLSLHQLTESRSLASVNEPMLFPPGQWTTLEIVARGNRFIVKVNGKTTVDYTDAKKTFSGGLIALQQLNPQTVVEFRKIEIIDLKAVPAPPVVAAGDFVPLFNGKDLAGWLIPSNSKGSWRVENGILIGSGASSGQCFTTRDDYKNFHLRMEARISDKGMGGVHFRTPLNTSGGYYTLINSNQNASKTGTVYLNHLGKNISLAKVPKTPVAAGEWFTLEIIADSNRLIVLVNGVKTTDVNDDSLQLGHVMLRQNPNATIEFSKIEIKELNAAAGVNVDQEQLVIDAKGGASVIGGPNDQQQAQVVTAGVSGRLVEVRLPILGTKGDLLLTIQGVTGGLPNGAVLTSELIPPAKLPTMKSPVKGFLSFRLTKPVIVTKGEPFAMVLSCKGSLAISNGPVGDLYSGGDGFYRDKKVDRWVPVGFRKDLPFQTLVESTPGAAPPPVVPAEGFVPLFNGKDLTGWKQEGKAMGAWRVENGILVGSGPLTSRYLHTLRDDFKDFHLRVEMRFNPKGMGAIFGRAERNSPKSTQIFAGYAALINAKTPGSLQAIYVADYKMKVAKPALAKADEWFVLEMLAEQDHVNIKINGTTSIDYVDKEPQPRQSGSILLSYFSNDAVFEFRKIEIKELNAAKTSPVVATDGWTDREILTKALILTKPQAPGGPHQVGDSVKITYQIVNQTNAAIQLQKTAKGTLQHWVERLGPDATIDAIPAKIARSGRKYAAGGAAFSVQAQIPKGKIYPLQQAVNTKGYPPGMYRYYVEFKDEQGAVLQSEQVEFELQKKD